MIPVTVYVRESRLEDFYVRFAEFIRNVPAPDEPVRLASGLVPAWVQHDKAEEFALRLMTEISGPGHSVLRRLTEAARRETAYFTPDELADATGLPQGKSRVAGILGGVGKAIRRAELPVYRTPSGGTWHYVWGWDGERYSMTPEVAKLLRAAARRI